MGEARQPKNGGDGAAKQKDNKQKSQTKQLIIMIAALLLCVVLITWTVLLMKERFSQQNRTNEQSSRADVLEMSRGDSSEDEAQQTAAEFTEASTTVTTVTTLSTESGTATMTNATAPAKITVQSVVFSKVTGGANSRTTTTKTVATTQPHQGGTTQPHQGGGAATTATTAAATLTPSGAPSDAQVGYNQLLALYLAASSDGTAYFVDAQGNSQPTVILRGGSSYYVSSPADDFSIRNRLGGTGDAAEHPWQTDADFMFRRYDANSRYIYYTSQGNNYQILGYYDTATCENVWARLHYYQIGVAWQSEYHIHYTHRTDAGGTEMEVNSGTCDTTGLYQVSLDFQHSLDQELQNRGISVGSWADYIELHPNSQADTQTLWSKAGSYNANFKVNAGETCGAIAANGTAPLRASAGGNIIAELPAGTLVSLSKAAAQTAAGSVQVTALVNGEMTEGYAEAAQILAWSAP